MMVFEGLFKLVGYVKRGPTSSYGVPPDLLAKAETELDEIVRLREQNAELWAANKKIFDEMAVLCKQNAEMRWLLNHVTLTAQVNLETRRWPLKYAAPWGALAKINDWLKENPE